MKKTNKKLAYKGVILCAVLLITNVIIAKDITFGKNYNWNYTVGEHAVIVLNNYDCDVTIHSSSSKEVRFEIEINAESKDQEDINILNSYLENLSFSAKSDLVKLETNFWEKRSSNNSLGKKVIKMKLKNGKSIQLSEFEVQANLHIPASALLELHTKYSNIKIEDIQELKLDSYDDEIYGKNVLQEATISAKYSDMEFVEFGPTNLDLYDCNFNAERTKDIEIKSKYSEIKIDYTGNIEVDGYQDNMTFKSTGDIDIDAKYSSIRSSTSGNLTLDIYDSNFDIKEVGDIVIKASKYAEYKIANTGIIKISDSYDDNFSIEYLKSIKINNTKYSDFDIGNLEMSFEILEGYDDNVKIKSTSSSFTHLDVTSKYGDIILRTYDGLPLRIDWKTKYGNIDLDESKFITRIKIKENSEFEYQGLRGAESENMPFVNVRGYDVKMNLSE